MMISTLTTPSATTRQWRIVPATLTLLLLAFALLSISYAKAEGTKKEGYYLAESAESFDIAIADLQDAIINQGLVIDFNGHTGDMLERTAEAVNQDSPLAQAEYFNFCSAALTHAAIAANPENMAICPFVVFAYQLKSDTNTVYLGYRRPIGATDVASTKALADIDAFLQSIVDEAAFGQ